jgi:ankyrin repeat protein
MVSDLSQACSEGDLNKVNQLLAQASPLDIEEKGLPLFHNFFVPHPSHHTLHPSLRASPLSLLVSSKDQDSVTPLIAAVKNGHRDVVKALLSHGAPHLPCPLHSTLTNALYSTRCKPCSRIDSRPSRAVHNRYCYRGIAPFCSSSQGHS